MKKIQFNNFESNNLKSFIEKTWGAAFVDKLPPMSFTFLNEDSVENRIELRKTINKEQGNHVLVSGNSDLAQLAWKANTMGFLLVDDNDFEKPLELLRERIRSYPPAELIAEDKLKINYKGGFDLIKLSEICFCSGSGNYTEIIMQNGKKKCISYPISKIDERLKKISFLERIGKSFIINYNLVKSVKKNKVIFKGTFDLELELSNTYIKRIKQNLLWY